MKIIQSPNYSGGPKENFRAAVTSKQKRKWLNQKQTSKQKTKGKKKKGEWIPGSEKQELVTLTA